MNLVGKVWNSSHFHQSPLQCYLPRRVPVQKVQLCVCGVQTVSFQVRALGTGKGCCSNFVWLCLYGGLIVSYPSPIPYCLVSELQYIYIYTVYCVWLCGSLVTGQYTFNLSRQPEIVSVSRCGV